MKRGGQVQLAEGEVDACGNEGRGEDEGADLHFESIRLVSTIYSAFMFLCQRRGERHTQHY